MFTLAIRPEFSWGVVIGVGLLMLASFVVGHLYQMGRLDRALFVLSLLFGVAIPVTYVVALATWPTDYMSVLNNVKLPILYDGTGMADEGINVKYAAIWLLRASFASFIGAIASAFLFLYMEEHFGVTEGWKPPRVSLEGFRHYTETRVVSKEIPFHPVDWTKPFKV